MCPATFLVRSRVAVAPVSFSDDFNRSDRSLYSDNGWFYVGNLATDGSVSPQIGIVSNQAKSTFYETAYSNWPGNGSGTYGQGIAHLGVDSNPDVHEFSFDLVHTTAGVDTPFTFVIAGDQPVDFTDGGLSRSITFTSGIIFQGNAQGGTYIVRRITGRSTNDNIQFPTVTPDGRGTTTRIVASLVRSTGVLTLNVGGNVHTLSGFTGLTGKYFYLGFSTPDTATYVRYDNVNIPIVSFNDNFNRADTSTTVGNGWIYPATDGSLPGQETASGTGAYAISSNNLGTTAGPSNANAVDTLFYPLLKNANKAAVDMAVDILEVTSTPGLVWAYTDKNNCYYVRVSGTSAIIRNMTNGVRSNLNSITVPVAPFNLRIVYDGAGQTLLYVDGVLSATANSTVKTGTHHGLIAVSSAVPDVFDNFTLV